MANATMKAPTRMPPTSRTGVPSSGGSSSDPAGGGGGPSGGSSVTSGLAARAASAASVASGSGATGVVVQAAPADGPEIPGVIIHIELDVTPDHLIGQFLGVLLHGGQ